MNRERLIDLDQFLAVAEITGERFGIRNLRHCAVGRWAEDRGLFAGFELQNYEALGYTRIVQDLGTSCTKLSPIWVANDASGGDPAAVRVALHRSFPEAFTTVVHEEAK